MCPLYPLHLLLCYGGLMVVTWLVAGNSVASALSRSSLSPRLALNNSLLSAISLTEGEQQQITFYIDDLPEDYVGELLVQISSSDGLEHLRLAPHTFPVNRNVTTETWPQGFPVEDAPSDKADPDSIAVVEKSVVPSPPRPQAAESSGRYLQGNFTAEGVFMGFSQVKFVLSNGKDDELMESPPVQAKVERGHHVADKVFLHVIILLVIIVYINMGCAIDLDVIKQTLRRPVAPVIGLLSQYIFMPLFSYGLGAALLAPTPALWLGLFVTGCSPGGGGSNMWTLLLGGSLNLSVTMTFISTVAALVCMPLWLWALAPTIFADGQFDNPPYRNIAMLALGLILPISLGLALKRFCPKGAALLRKLLKPLCIFFIVFVMTFGVFAYWPIFQYFTWRVALCGLLLPVLGFIAGAVAAVGTKRPLEDAIAISVETGLQNTGLAITLLKVSLSSLSPLGDIAMVVPIAVATLTPLPLLVAYCWVQYRQWGSAKNKDDLVEVSSDTTCNVA